MNENQARLLANVYASMGYDTVAESTGGNVWLVTVRSDNGSEVQFGIDTVTKIAGPLLSEWPKTINLA